MSVATVLAVALAIADLAARERRMPQRSTMPPLFIRVSLVFFAAYVPFAWLIWFEESAEYRRELLSLWLAFPGVVSAQAFLSIVSGRASDRLLTAVLAMLVSGAFAWIAISIARRGWWWTVATAAFTAAVCSALSVVTYALARM